MRLEVVEDDVIMEEPKREDEEEYEVALEETGFVGNEL